MKLHPWLFLCFVLLLMSCQHQVMFARPKGFEPEVTEPGKLESCWYRFIPEAYPGFCLETRQGLVWKDPKMHLGCWRGRHPKAPHRVLMEAHGDTFLLHPGYRWDGMTWGVTQVRDLYPTLLHDALYHALQGGAPFERREADLAYLRAQRSVKAPDAFGQYIAVRCFGGWFNRQHDEATIIIEIANEHQSFTPVKKSGS